jgi:GNAT superfamily N-acetyltransferase
MEIEWIEQAQDVQRVRGSILCLFNESTLEEGMIGYAEPLTAEESAELVDGIQRAVARGNGRLLLVTDAAGPCGIAFIETNTAHNSRHIATMKRGYISPRARGGGLLARALMAIVEKARSLNVEQLALDTREGSRAHQIWSHLGFQTWGVMPDYSRYNGVAYRGCYMSQSVDAMEEQVTRKIKGGANA